jgi:Raf kinase inhibitor-like YbhB/YbcL family protein
MVKLCCGLKLITIVSLLTTILLACEVSIEKTAEPKAETSQTNTKIPMEETLAILHVDSSALPEGVYLPHKYTCKDIDVSPPLQWSNIPQATKSFALILDDPDAIGGSFVHWVLYNIPSDTTSLEENLPHAGTLPDGSIQGTNDFGNLGYNGPCPQGAFGKVHNWVFSIYALDVKIKLPPGVTNAELMNIISKHILAKGILIRKYRAPSTSYGKYIPRKEYLSLSYSI